MNCLQISIFDRVLTIARMMGEDVGPMKSVNEVTRVPKSFSNWITKNQDRIDRAKVKPYFITDNLLFAGQKNLTAEVNELMKQAKSAGTEVDLLGNKYAEKFKGTVTPINYKGEGSITRKLKDELGGDIDGIKDTVRNTIILPKGKIEKAVREMQKDSRFVRIKRQQASNHMGYTGTITNIKTKNGLIGEVQINTDKMIYAKEKPEIAKKIIGESRWNQIRKETGMEGGLGHKYYEEYRVIKNKNSAIALEIREKSVEYYSHFN